MQFNKCFLLFHTCVLYPFSGPLFVPGMSITGPGASVIAASNAITSGAGDNSLASILGSSNVGAGSSASTVQTANIEGLASLLNQPPPPALASFSSVSFDQFSPSK